MSLEPSRDASADAARRRVRVLAEWLDTAFRVPGTNIRVGLEPIIGLVPFVGDVAGLLLSAWLVIEAMRAGAPGSLILRMLVNVAIDALVGLVPLLGDLFDFGYKANARNARLLERHLNPRVEPPAAPRQRLLGGLGLALLVVLVTALAVWLSGRLLATL